MNTLKRIPLTQTITLQRGFDLPETSRQPGTTPVVASTGIIGYHNEPRVQGPGVVIGRSGSIGGGQYIESDFWPLNTTLWVKDFNGHDPRFVYFMLRCIDFSRFNAGAGVPTLNRNHLSSVLVPDFGSDSEKRIADTLSTYDDLIANNRRRIKLLEESARLLFKEWFIRLRFPGHEHLQIVNGIPKGWKTYTVDDLCHVGRGASPRPIAAFMNGSIPWFKIGDATASQSLYIFETKEHVTEDGAKKSIVLEPGALILSNSATCGIPYFTAVAGCIHDGWLYFSNFKRISPQFFYFFLCFKRNELVSSVGDGSTQKNLNTNVVGRLKIIIPSDDWLIHQFDEAVKPVFGIILNLATQNDRLSAARDLLLPRLMNGTIKV